MKMASNYAASAPQSVQRSKRRLRVLIVNVFFDDWRQMTRSPNKVPQASAQIYLAGVFRRELCEVRVYNEHQSGPLTDESLFGWPDLLVLTGLNVAFDRMLHLTAYLRSKQPKLRVVAGGHAIRAMPRLAARYFDWACTGDFESLADIVRAEFGADYVADVMLPRFDLVRHNSWLGYIEASRNCNFKCSFCTMTGERNAYLNTELELLRTQILSMGYKRHLLFLDNNFYGSGKRDFRERMVMLRELRDSKRFGSWSAMVTSDFFLDEENLDLARQAGCIALFSGVESFDEEVLRDAHKRQNTVLPQFDIMYRSLDAGIMFHYGLILDLSTRLLADVRNELKVLFGNPNITLPSFLSLTIPLIGTPFFSECVSEGRILANAKLRDCDGFTLTLKPRDPMHEAVEFVRHLPTLKGYRRRIAGKAARLLWRYRRSMTPFQLMLMTSSAFLLSAPNVVNAPFRRQHGRSKRTCITTTEPVDPLYTPLFSMEDRFREYFEPTFVTNADGELSAALRMDYDAAGNRLGSRPNPPKNNIRLSRSREQLLTAGEC
jgi:hypothetical protein